MGRNRGEIRQVLLLGGTGVCCAIDQSARGTARCGTPFSYPLKRGSLVTSSLPFQNRFCRLLLHFQSIMALNITLRVTAKQTNLASGKHVLSLFGPLSSFGEGRSLVDSNCLIHVVVSIGLILSIRSPFSIFVGSPLLSNIDEGASEQGNHTLPGNCLGESNSWWSLLPHSSNFVL